MTSFEWAMVLGMAAVTFGVRYPVLALVSRVSLPPAALNALRYVPPAVLAAIITPAVLMPDGQQIDLSLDNAYLVAAVVAIGVSLWKKNLLLTLGAGMAVFLLWRLVM